MLYIEEKSIDTKFALVQNFIFTKNFFLFAKFHFRLKSNRVFSRENMTVKFLSMFNERESKSIYVCVYMCLCACVRVNYKKNVNIEILVNRRVVDTNQNFNDFFSMTN